MLREPLEIVMFVLMLLLTWWVAIFFVRMITRPRVIRLIAMCAKREAQEKFGKGIVGFFYFVGLFLDEYQEL